VTATDLLATWADRPAAERRLSLADLLRGARDWPRVVRGPIVAASRDAAVLIPVFDDGEGLQVVMIERAHDIGTHRGDIAFPGGSCDPGEPGEAAALRETEEEVGIPAASITVAAALSTHPIMSGFVIWPYIGVLPARPDLRHRSPEVARTLVVNVTDLLADGRWRQERWPGADGNLLDFFAVPGGVAWGTTGDLLRELLEICITGRTGQPLLPGCLEKAELVTIVDGDHPPECEMGGGEHVGTVRGRVDQRRPHSLRRGGVHVPH